VDAAAEKLLRFQGCLAGLACGDAVGTTLEFSPPGSFEPIDDMPGGGPFDLKPGAWTDDTSMALCLASSLIHRQGFDAADQMNRYCNWKNYGYMSSTGSCFDIGMTVSSALERYIATGNPMAGSTDPRSSGNGSLMRLAPIPMFYYADLEQVERYSGLSSQTTHASEECIEACKLFGRMIAMALMGASKHQILAEHGFITACPGIREIARGSYIKKQYTDLTGSGYVVASLESALWCFARHDNYRNTVLAAANLGNDADTTAAVAGQLAGAYYGLMGIPEKWIGNLVMKDEILSMSASLMSKR
jgi:ADP-ribosyl-[dinitrogen reductase] hydrolase